MIVGKGAVLNIALDLATPESHLWEAANILRGPVDAADFKTYIFPLLFFKRISDAYDEETRLALDELAANDWDLNIPRYVEPVIEEETLTVAEAIENLKRALGEAYAAEDHLKELLQAAGLM